VINLFQNIGALELIVIGIVVLVLFGGKKLPELAHGIADAIKEFRKAFKDDSSKKDESE
jgi:sec-independent protein translocase protein TatA